MRTRTRPGAAFALALLGAFLPATAPDAFAGDDPVLEARLQNADRTCTFEFGGADVALRDDCSRRLSVWWDEILAPDQPPPAGWDEKKLGPWSLVARTSGGGFVEERPGYVHVMVSVVAEGLPSRSDAADALIRAIVGAFEQRTRDRADALFEAPHRQARLDLNTAQNDVQKAYASIREITAAHGGPPERRSDSIATLLTDAERDASRTRIDRAVTAKQLDAARTAAERATELLELRRDADELERAVNRTNDGPPREALSLKLATLRAKIDDLAKSCPPLDAAREQVFRLEVDLVGLEARSAVLAEELKTLRDEGSRVEDDVRRHDAVVRELVAAQAAVSEATTRLKSIVRSAVSRGPVFQVIRAPGPPSKRQEEKR